MAKIFIVLQESNVDGELIINPVPCISLELAQKTLKKEAYTILTESHHFSGYTADELEENFEIEFTDDRFYINDHCDDYYEDIRIIEKELVTE